jgi:hypothetical protein
VNMMNNTPENHCTPTFPEYTLLTPEEKQRFDFIVHQLWKQGMALDLAQEMAFSRVMCEDIQLDLK